MVDLVAQNQIKVLFKRLDPESQALALIALVNSMPDTHFGIDIDEKIYAVDEAAGDLLALVQSCPQLSRECFDPISSRADRAYDEMREQEDDL